MIEVAADGATNEVTGVTGAVADGATGATGATADERAGGAPTFGVYVHWPFCAAKCPYCDFNSHVRRVAPDQARFAAAFDAEMRHAAALTGPREVASVFLGGGTPSLMHPATVASTLDSVARHFSLAPEAEITLEANPTSVEATRFRGYRAAGVNRVSLGVQALDDAPLRALGRLHGADQAVAAIETARATFPRLSFDLIYARPHQTTAEWEAELARALALSADHLSLYQLTIEAGTPFHDLHRRGRLVVPGDDLSAEMFELTAAMTADAGLPRYEISNHAAPGAESRHNLTYWRGHDWAGIGPGAHGRLTVGDARLSTATERGPEAWLARVEARGHGWVEEAPLTDAERADEMLVMGMRLNEGIDAGAYAALAGRPLDAGAEALLAREGLVARSGPRIACTPAGMLVLDAVLAALAA